MTRDELQARIETLAAADERVQALLLSGSVGRGEADAWSDLDLIAVVAPEHHGAFTSGIRDWLEQAAPIVLLETVPGLPVYVVVTEDWVRFDVTVTVPGRVFGSRNAIRPLLDRADVWDQLPPAFPSRPPDPERVAAATREFLRCLGLLPVSLGREDWAVAASGVGLMRGQLVSLMIDDLDLAARPGALKLKGLLATEDYAALLALPAPGPDRASVVAATRALAEAYLPRARSLHDRIGAPWPSELEAALQAHLARSLGADWPLL